MSFFFLCIAYVCILAVIVVGFRILIWVARPCFRALSSGTAVFGETWQVRLVGLGIVAFLFQSTVVAACRLPVEVILAGFDLLAGSFEGLARQTSMIASSSSGKWENLWENQNWPNHISDLLAGEFRVNFARHWGNIRTVFLTLPFSHILMATAVWVVIGQALSSGPLARELNFFSRLIAWYRSNAKRSQDLLLWLTIAAGAYLSLAAIVATSEIRNPDALSVAEQSSFDKQISEVLGDQDSSDKLLADPVFESTPFLAELESLAETEGFPTPSGASTSPATSPPSVTPGAPPQAAVNTPPDPAPPTNSSPVAPPSPDNSAATVAAPVPDPAAVAQESPSTPPNSGSPGSDSSQKQTSKDEVRGFVQEAKNMQQEALQSWQRQTTRLKAFRDSLRSTSKSMFEQHSPDLNPRARMRYAGQLRQAVQEQWEEARREFTSFRSRIRFIDSLIREEAQQACLSYRNRQMDSGFSLRAPPRELVSLYDDDRGPSLVASLPYPGEATLLGPFHYIADWLVDIRSLALTLVTGMIGFGIMGSATSSFVKQQQKRAANDPLVPDLPAVVIRGMSAAVVVFLSVKGGLAIFTANEAEPNAYVLFFTCFAGAVFSENIWEWAKSKLLSTFSGENESGQGKGKGDKAAGKPPKAGDDAAKV